MILIESLRKRTEQNRKTYIQKQYKEVTNTIENSVYNENSPHNSMFFHSLEREVISMLNSDGFRVIPSFSEYYKRNGYTVKW